MAREKKFFFSKYEMRIQRYIFLLIVSMCSVTTSKDFFAHIITIINVEKYAFLERQ